MIYSILCRKHAKRIFAGAFLLSYISLIFFENGINSLFRNISTNYQDYQHGCIEMSNFRIENEEYFGNFSVDVYQSFHGGEIISSGRRKSMEHMILASPSDFRYSSIKVNHIIADYKNDRGGFLGVVGKKCYPAEDNLLYRRFVELNEKNLTQYAAELWKYCSLMLTGGAYIDHESHLLQSFRDTVPIYRNADGDKKFGGINYAVLGDSHPGTIHGSLLVLDGLHSSVAFGMIKLIVETSVEVLRTTPFFLPLSLYKLISTDLDLDSTRLPLRPGLNENIDKSQAKWFLFEQRCSFEPYNGALLDRNLKTFSDNFFSFWNWIPSSVRIAYQCETEKNCCTITDPCTDENIMVSNHPVLPHQKHEALSMPFPYFYDANSLQDSDEITLELQKNNFFISTIKVEEFSRPGDFPATPNFYAILESTDSLPLSGLCAGCMSDFKGEHGGSCEKCSHVSEDCRVYCTTLCRERPHQKFVSKHLIVSLPRYLKDPSRLIPKIIHQTWSEEVTKENYPDGSRLVESWKQSGWEYQFYDNDSSEDFLRIHFPSEILEAYNAVLPGAFKADLFRYCVLFITGGLYADMDLLLESNLDPAIPFDVGFIAPLDSPGRPVKEESCLWNGLMAAAPGHPFLATTIESVVNGIRNRFTTMDLDNFLCPDVTFAVSHAHVVLYPTGPCILGASVNKALGRRPQTQFSHGEIDHFGHDFLEEEYNQDIRKNIPGRSIILSRRIDMGSHRFKWDDTKLIVAMEANLKNERAGKATAHYKSSRVDGKIYGLENLYTDRIVADEDIKIILPDF